MFNDIQISCHLKNISELENVKWQCSLEIPKNLESGNPERNKISISRDFTGVFLKTVSLSLKILKQLLLIKFKNLKMYQIHSFVKAH